MFIFYMATKKNIFKALLHDNIPLINSLDSKFIKSKHNCYLKRKGKLDCSLHPFIINLQFNRLSYLSYYFVPFSLKHKHNFPLLFRVSLNEINY